MSRTIRSITVLATAAVAAACGGGSGAGDGGTGLLKVSLTDAPACGYDNVWVTVSKVRVHRSPDAGENDAGWSEIVVDSSGRGRRIDLLELQNGVLADLGQMALPAGHYSQVRLVLADNAAVANANELVLSGTKARVPLDTPSAQQSGLKLKHGFDVEEGTEVDLVLDFDACRSIVRAGNSGKYNLKPVISVMPVLTGSVIGAVDPDAARARASVSLQRFDATTGVVSVVRATTVKADGSWILSPVPVSPSGGPGYNVVISSSGYGNVVYTNVPVTSGVPTEVPDVVLATSNERRISGNLLVNGNGAGEVRALQTVVEPGATKAEVIIEAAFANADSETGHYDLFVPAAAAKVATFGGSLDTGASAGIYTVSARAGGETGSAEADVSAKDSVIHFPF